MEQKQVFRAWYRFSVMAQIIFIWAVIGFLLLAGLHIAGIVGVPDGKIPPGAGWGAIVLAGLCFLVSFLYFRYETTGHPDGTLVHGVLTKHRFTPATHHYRYRTIPNAQYKGGPVRKLIMTDNAGKDICKIALDQEWEICQWVERHYEDADTAFFGSGEGRLNKKLPRANLPQRRRPT